ncbi:hypothetical protein RI367_007775 [Sorochytrium milnesiophthora]
MIEREYHPQIVDWTLPEKVASKSGVTHVQHRDFRGGLLCDDMGTGKTVMCLALILQTLDRPFAPLQQHELGLRVHFCHREKQDTLLHRCMEVVSIYQRNWQESVSPAVKSKLQSARLYYEEYNSVKTGRTTTVLTREVMYVSTTLVVVPDNLVMQWDNEIMRHVRQGVLKYAVLSQPQQVFPSAEQLHQLDLVVVSVRRFSLENPFTSPLNAIHFKRIIVDEGHIFGANSVTNAKHLLCLLRATCRWVCSGTPTKNLATVTLSDAAHMPLHELGSQDLGHLGTIFSTFLRMEPFYSTHGQRRLKWTDVVVKPFNDQAPGSLEAVQDILQRVLVRNRSEDVQAQVQLPPLTERVVWLAPSWFERLTYNVLIVGLYVNAILTEREHQDYFFHPMNQAQLRNLTRNLRSATTSTSTLQTDLALYHLRSSIDQALQKDKWNPADRAKLEECMDVMNEAFAHPHFAWIHNVAARPVVVRNVPRLLHAAMPYTFASMGQEDVTWCDISSAEQLSVLGERLRDLPPTPFEQHASEPESVLLTDIARKQPVWTPEAFFQQVDKGAGDGTRFSIRKHHYPPQRYQVLHATFLDIDGDHNASVRDALTRQLARCELTKTLSTKLNYLLKRIRAILRASATEKVIVFCNTEHEILVVSQVLEMAQIPCLLFTMRKMARGIDLSVASHVFFLSPVYSYDVERQAVKRAHRIGQTHPVHVEYLALLGSVDQYTVQRRLMPEAADNDTGKDEHPKKSPNKRARPETQGDVTSQLQRKRLHAGHVGGKRKSKSLAGAGDAPNNTASVLSRGDMERDTHFRRMLEHADFLRDSGHGVPSVPAYMQTSVVVTQAEAEFDPIPMLPPTPAQCPLPQQSVDVVNGPADVERVTRVKFALPGDDFEMLVQVNETVYDQHQRQPLAPHPSSRPSVAGGNAVPLVRRRLQQEQPAAAAFKSTTERNIFPITATAGPGYYATDARLASEQQQQTTVSQKGNAPFAAKIRRFSAPERATSRIGPGQYAAPDTVGASGNGCTSAFKPSLLAPVPATKRFVDPGPAQYAVSAGHFSKEKEQSGARSSFQSSTKRFTREEITPDGVAPNSYRTDAVRVDAGGSGGTAAFKSLEPKIEFTHRFKEPGSDQPGPGMYDIAKAWRSILRCPPGVVIKQDTYVPEKTEATTPKGQWYDVPTSDAYMQRKSMRRRVEGVWV